MVKFSFLFLFSGKEYGLIENSKHVYNFLRMSLTLRLKRERKTAHYDKSLEEEINKSSVISLINEQ